MIKLIHVLTVPQSLVFLKGQIGYMKARGLEIVVVSSPGEYLEQFAAQEQVAFHAVPMTRKITPFKDLLSLFRLYDLFRKQRPDIVHGSTPKAGLLSMLGAKLARVPVRVYTARGLPFESSKGKRRFVMKGIEGFTCLLAHKIIAVGPSVARVLACEEICSATKIAVIGNGSSNGLNADKFNPSFNGADKLKAFRQKHGIPEGARTIGFVGRLVRSKGVHELIDAWNILKREFSSLHLLVVGPTEEEDPVEAKVLKQIQTDPRISYTGELSDVVPAYGVMDLLVLPTHREGFSNVLIEAGAMGMAVVATSVTGCIDAVENGKTGVLVPARDAVALAGAIRMYLKNGDLRREHGRTARERVLKHFRPADIWEGIYQVYFGLLQERECPRNRSDRSRSAEELC